MSLGGLQTSLHHLNVLLRSFPALLRLLLEAMEDVNGADKPDGIDRAIGVPIKVIDHFEDASPAKTPESLDGRMFVSILSVIDRNTITRRIFTGNSRRSSLDDPIHIAGFWPFICFEI
jgi:hypothetical protein